MNTFDESAASICTTYSNTFDHNVSRNNYVDEYRVEIRLKVIVAKMVSHTSEEWCKPWIFALSSFILGTSTNYYAL